MRTMDSGRAKAGHRIPNKVRLAHTFPDNCSPNDILRLADLMYTGSICCHAGFRGLGPRSVLQNTYSLQQVWQRKGLRMSKSNIGLGGDDLWV